jgi:hypothetical protein
MERFPERPWTKQWNAKELYRVIADVFGECLDWNGDERKLVIVRQRPKVEALYEYCASKGRLAEFERAWQEMEDDKRAG